MRPLDRQARIIDFVRREGRVSVDDLATRFRSSPETIRRDLGILSKSGKIHKIHGGAMPPRLFGEGLLKQRMLENVAAKRYIAQQAREIISQGETLFIDTGSTTLYFAEELAGIDDLTVITNSIEIAGSIGASNDSIRLFLLGGEYHSDNRETRGLAAIDQINAFRANHAVLTVGAVDADAGVMDFSMAEAQVARAMIARAEHTVMLADSSKFNRIASCAVGAFDRFDCLVCEAEPSGRLKAALARAKVDIIH
ncbi:MAG: DeoR/GlpR family DNA-binding transcription regulator [bacterium]